MSELLLVAACGITHLIALYLLASSGVLTDLFGRFRPGTEGEIDLLSEAPGAIDDHEFWSLSDEPLADDFWGAGDVAEAGDDRSAAEESADRIVAAEGALDPRLSGQAVDF